MSDLGGNPNCWFSHECFVYALANIDVQEHAKWAKKHLHVMRCICIAREEFDSLKA